MLYFVGDPKLPDALLEFFLTFRIWATCTRRDITGNQHFRSTTSREHTSWRVCPNNAIIKMSSAQRNTQDNVSFMGHKHLLHSLCSPHCSVWINQRANFRIRGQRRKGWYDWTICTSRQPPILLNSHNLPCPYAPHHPFSNHISSTNYALPCVRPWTWLFCI